MYTELIIEGVVLVLLLAICVFIYLKVRSWVAELHTMIKEELAADYDPHYLEIFKNHHLGENNDQATTDETEAGEDE